MGHKPIQPEVPSGFTFHHETRWSRVHLNSRGFQFRASKLRTGEASITLETLKREYPGWTSDERADFLDAFYSENVAHSREIFHYFISQATPEDRYRYSGVFPLNRDVKEAFDILSAWLADPATAHRHCLFLAVIQLAPSVGNDEAVALLERVLEQHTSRGEFWRNLESASYENARLVTECLAALGWLGKGEVSVPLLQRLVDAKVSIVSDRARQLVESAKVGQWSLST